MGRKIFIILILLRTTSALASPLPRTSSYVCGRITEVNIRNQCFELANNYTFDGYASGACDQFKDSNDTLACMNLIKGATYSPEGVFACEHYDNVALTEKCLEVIRNQYMMPSAVRGCERIEGEQKMICFGVIAGRKYSEEQVANCNSFEDPSTAVECFRY